MKRKISAYVERPYSTEQLFQISFYLPPPNLFSFLTKSCLHPIHGINSHFSQLFSFFPFASVLTASREEHVKKKASPQGTLTSSSGTEETRGHFEGGLQELLFESFMTKLENVNSTEMPEFSGPDIGW